MRDPKRIRVVMQELEKLWLANADLRFFQLISWVGAADQHFYVEDDGALALIRGCQLQEKKDTPL